MKQQNCSDHDYKVFARRGLVMRLGWSIKYDAICLLEGTEHVEDEKSIVDSVTFQVIKNGILCNIHWNGTSMTVNDTDIPVFIQEV